MPAAPLDFTDGDTAKRFTITSPDILPGSLISVPTIQRANTEEVDDQGWSYHASVSKVVAGSFDVNVCALMLGEPPINDEYPNEQVNLIWTIEGRYPY